MKVEQISKNSYRVRKQYKGRSYTLYFDRKPTDKEVNAKLYDFYNTEGITAKNKGKLRGYMEEYLSIKENVLSPSTIRSYKQLIGMFPEWILNMNISDIEQSDVQRCINDYSISHSPKSVKNLNGFLIAVLKMYRPNFRINVTLPKRIPKDIVLPTKEEVMAILTELKDTEYHIPIQLACCGLRKSEIVALTINDLDGNILSINKGVVTDKDNLLVVKDMPKTIASVRQIYIPDKLADEIRDRGYVYKGFPGNILRALHRTQDKLGIERFRLHDLRHFYVSYAHSMGMPDVEIMKAVGHSTDSTTKRVYRHSLDRNREEQRRIADSLL